MHLSDMMLMLLLPDEVTSVLFDFTLGCDISVIIICESAALHIANFA